MSGPFSAPPPPPPDDARSLAAWRGVLLGIAEWTGEDPETIADIAGHEPPDAGEDGAS